MKQLLLAFCALCMTLPVFADTWLDPDTGYRWTYTLSDGKAILGPSGTSPAVDPAPSGHIDIPETLGGLPVTVIGDYAFSGCNELTSVRLPEGLTAIGEYAFSDCYGLTSLTLPEGLTAIGEYAFIGCSGLPTDEEGVRYESAARRLLIEAPDSLSGVSCGSSIPRRFSGATN